MSMNFEKPLTEDQQSFIKDAFGDQLKALDDQVGLLESKAFNQKQMKNIANEIGQVLTVELNSIGDRKEVGGIIYELDERGWKKLPIGTTL